MKASAVRVMFYPVRKAILRWIPALSWMALIFWFSSQTDLPGLNDNRIDLVFKKTAHFVVYGILALCYLFALGGGQSKRFAFALSVLYAVSDEYHQSWTPLRTPSLVDVLVDAAGAAIMLWLVAPWLQHLLQKQLKVRLPVPSEQVPKRTLQAVNRFIAQPKTKQRTDD